MKILGRSACSESVGLRLMRNPGLTLIELLVVIAIIGVISAIVIPAVSRIKESATVSTTAANLVTFSKGFRAYEKLEGDWPPDDVQGTMPPGVGVELYLSEGDFESATPVGGRYNWDGPEVHSYAGVSIQGATAPSTLFARIDEIVDDGNLGTGDFLQTPNGRYTYVIEWNNP